MRRIAVFGLAMLLMGMSYESHAVNFAVFHKVDKSMEFEDIVEGSHSSFLQNMESHGAEILALTNIPHAVNNDVITLQTSALHDREGALGDFGIDCHLSYKDEINKEGENQHYLGGICKVIRQGRGHDIKNTVLMQHVNIIDSSQGFHGWIKVAEDKETGVAFYATVR